MTLRPGEVVLIRIDFHQTPGGKLRPAVVLLDSVNLQNRIGAESGKPYAGIR